MDTDAPLLTNKSMTAKIFLAISMILPVVIVPIFLNTTHNGILTMIIYCFLCLLLVPAIYLATFTRGKRAILSYFSGEEGISKSNIKKILILAISLLILTLIFTYMVFKNMDIEKKMRIPFNISDGRQKGIIIIGGVFYIPILEELFWRLFLVKSFGNYIWVSPLISLIYGLLYFFISLYMLSWQYALLTFLLSGSLSIFLIYLKKMFRITSVIIIREGVNIGLLIGFYSFLGEIK